MSVVDYADFLFFEYLLTEEFSAQVKGRWIEQTELEAILKNTMRQVFIGQGFEVGSVFDELVVENIDWLVEKRAVATEGDNYTGVHYKFNINKSAESIGAFLGVHEVANRIKALGPEALRRALSRMADEENWKVFLPDSPESTSFVSPIIPASDRLVEIDHNSSNYRDLVELTEVADEAIRSSNSIEEDGRQWIRDHLKAGLALIKAHKVLATAASAILLTPLLNAYNAVAEEPAKHAILAAINAVRQFFGL